MEQGNFGFVICDCMDAGTLNAERSTLNAQRSTLNPDPITDFQTAKRKNPKTLQIDI
jgi:hypothetical protein